MVYGLAASTGGQIWKFIRPDGSLGYAAPVYVPAEAVTLVANAATQQPTFSGDTDALVVCGDTTVYRLDPANGHQVWHTPVGGKSLATPAVGGGRVYVGGDGPGLTALALGDGHQIWAFAGKSDHDWFGAPLLADGILYVATHNRFVYAVDAATGAPRWSTRLMTPGNVAPALDAKRHVLYVTTTTFGDNATLTALDSRSGTKLWETKIGPINGSPVLSGDKLYVGATSGYFYCYGLR
jgi:outer membrane protein assembly factor BamB